MQPGANVVKLFTDVFYGNSIVIPYFCVVKLNYHGNYLGMVISNTRVFKKMIKCHLVESQLVKCLG